MGGILGRALDVLSQHFLPFVAISAIAVVPSLVYSALASKPSTANTWLLLGINIIVSAVCDAMIVYAAFQALRGRPVRIGESMAVGVRRLGPVLVASIVTGLVQTLGLFLLVVPGLIAMVMFFVTEPACVVERLGPFDSIGRSVDLTRGYRWAIFGLAFVVGLVGLIVSTILIATLRHPSSLLFFTIATYVWNTLTTAYMAVLVAIVYHDLRVLKEGIDLDRIAAVFD